ncbi:MAG: TadE/TadG family type IV pilus assembly protein [Micavibrio sp.]
MRNKKRVSFLRRTEGSMAVEFALLIIPFIYTTFAIIELSLFFAASNMLEGGINESARLIRTGQLQEQEELPPEEAFRNDLCNRLFVLVDCDEVDIEVIALPDDDFTSAADYPLIYDEDGNVEPRPFDAGGADDVVMIRATYRYQLITPMFAEIFSREDDNTIPIMTTIVLQSEPYEES